MLSWIPGKPIFPFFKNFRYVLLWILPFVISCSTASSLQPQINSLVIAGKFNQAVKILETHPEAYGANSELLYLLDRALVEHMARRYKESISLFEKAKQKFDELYTKSVTRIATSWIVNEYTSPYRGEDFERVLINIFQALNYAALGDIEEALVEARDVDSLLKAVNRQYPSNKSNVYREDAFARFLMGILYESALTHKDLNDAHISYTQAADIYERIYVPEYHLQIPQILKENILTTAQYMGKDEFEKYQDRYGPIPFLSLEEKSRAVEVYLIQYSGLAPLKFQDNIPIPLPEGYVTKMAFPKYHERYFDKADSQLVAQDSQGQLFTAPTEMGQDLSAIATKDLESRRLRIMAKAALRPMAKYALERQAQEKIEKEHGQTPSVWFQSAGNLYNVFSEQADLRSWQTLPAQIRMARVILRPGVYTFFVKNLDGQGGVLGQIHLGELELQAGEKRFFIIRTSQ